MDAPDLFEADLRTFAAKDAVVFDGIRGYQRLWWLLNGKRTKPTFTAMT